LKQSCRAGYEHDDPEIVCIADYSISRYSTKFSIEDFDKLNQGGLT